MGCCGRRTTWFYKTQLAARTAKDVAKVAVTEGKILTNKEIIEKRIATCKACSHLSNGKCSICGCFMIIKSKLTAAACPINKW